MKKLLAIIMAISLAMPLANVFAANKDCSVDGTCYVYTKGDLVNFYYSDADYQRGQGDNKEDAEKAGRQTIILEDKGKDSLYVKTLAFDPVYNTGALMMPDLAAGFKYNKASYDKFNDASETPACKKDAASEECKKAYAATYAFTPINATIGRLGGLLGNAEPTETPYVKDLGESVGFVTVEELVAALNAKDNGDKTYTVSADTKIGKDQLTVGEALNPLAIELLAGYKGLNVIKDTVGEGSNTDKYSPKVGFYTSSISEDGKKIYVAEFNLKGEKGNEMIDTIEIKEVDMIDELNGGDLYAFVPTLMFNKTYECHERVTYSCYICDNEEYVWSEDGKQKDTCKIAEKIVNKSDCVKTPPTGVEEYIAEFIGVVGICGIALILIKRNDLFKTI